MISSFWRMKFNKKHVNSNNPKVLTLIRTYKHCIRRTLSAPNVYFDIHIANPLDISAMWNTHHKIKNYFLVWVQMDVSNIGSIAQNASIHLGDGWVMKKWNNNQWNYVSYICSVTRSHNVQPYLITIHVSGKIYFLAHFLSTIEVWTTRSVFHKWNFQICLSKICILIQISLRFKPPWVHLIIMNHCFTSPEPICICKHHRPPMAGVYTTTQLSENRY